MGYVASVGLYKLYLSYIQSTPNKNEFNNIYDGTFKMIVSFRKNTIAGKSISKA